MATIRLEAEKIPDGNKTDLSFFLKRTNFDHGPGAMKVIFYRYRMYDYFFHEKHKTLSLLIVFFMSFLMIPPPCS